jgi:phospholipase/lecithinase/hemolysin
VAGFYGMSFAECNPTSAEPRALMFAAVGTRVADLTAQIEAQVAAGGFRANDLALVMVGANDIVELYRQFPSRPEVDLVAEAGARGRQLAAAVNRLVALGAKVIVSTIPDVGLSPFARKEKSENFDIDRAALMSNMSAKFNEQLSVSLLLDGRFIGLIQADLRFQGANISPGSFGLVNASDAVCTVELPACDTSTVLPGADPNQFLWADGTRLAPGGQGQLAQLAVDRARRNPF